MNKATLSLLALAALTAPACQKSGPQGGFAVQVVVAEAKNESIDENIPLVGTLTANEAVEIQAETEGKVEQINFSEGQYVKKGRTLVVIDGAKLAALVAQAEATYNLSKANLDRAETLVKNNTISKQEYDQSVSRFEADKATLELNRQELNDATIEAPFSGRVGARLVSPGQVVEKGTIVTNLIDANPLKVEFTVPERYAGRLSTKLKVALTVSSISDRDFLGDVYFVSPFVDPATRTVLVKARVPNPEWTLQPGLFANIELNLGAIPDAVVVPESALMKQADSVQVYVVDSEKKADLRQVKTGVYLKGWVQIVEGVAAGEKVITEGVQKVRPGASVTFEEETAQAEAPAEEKPDAEVQVEKTEPAQS